MSEKRSFDEAGAFLDYLNDEKIPRHQRNLFYVDLSKKHNEALRDGKYEIAVACLMMMRLIRKQENAPDDALVLATDAAYIIKKAMIDKA